jgi:N-acetylglucosaminyl-diphospho-decaprenol L-rhamnosyltransferase
LSATVIVPSRGPAGRLRRLLDSLAPAPADEVLVVDNGSPGSEVSRLCAEHEVGEAIRLEHNAGYSAAVNLAARRAAGEVLVLLNDDCVCEPGFVERLAARVDPAASVTMAAGVLRDFRDPRLIDTAGMQLDRTLLVYDYLNGEPVERLAGGIADPIGPSAAAAAFDREQFLHLGGFDERLFAYWEDVDLVLRMLAEGAVCRLAPDAVGVHEHSATLGSGSAAKNRLMGFGRGYVVRRWSVLSARRAPGLLAREAVIAGGQLLLDRNAAGVSGRIAGWRAAAGLERRAYPAAVAARGGGDSLLRTLRRRLGRRRRLRSA